MKPISRLSLLVLLIAATASVDAQTEKQSKMHAGSAQDKAELPAGSNARAGRAPTQLRGRQQPVRGITLENVTGTAKQGLHGQNLNGIELRHVSFEAQEGRGFEWINASNIKFLPAAPAAGKGAAPRPSTPPKPSTQP